MSDYKSEIDSLINQDKIEEISRNIFIFYAPLKVSSEQLFSICDKINRKFNIPLRDIKIIGSSHTGFSFVKPKKSNTISYYTKESDIDIAIINKDLFYDYYLDTFIKTNGFSDNTHFRYPEHSSQFQNNIVKGFLRPDTLARTDKSSDWYYFFRDLSEEINQKITGAIYLSEETFSNKINESLKIYQYKLGGMYGD